MSNNTLSSSQLAFKQFSEGRLLSTIFDVAYQHQFAVALWMLPNALEKHVIVDTSGSLDPAKVDLEECPGGFICSPFNNPDGHNSRLIKAEFHLILKSQQAEIVADSGDFVAKLQKALENPEPRASYVTKESTSPPMHQQHYQQMVSDALQAIEEGTFIKVVPAVNRHIDLPEDFDPLQVFDQLCKTYPLAFKSLVSAPQIGTWLGASPEPIIEVDRHKKFSTAALAGTQEYDYQTPLREVAWRQKEIEEQALVSRYIINCFKRIRLREFEELGPKTVIAGNLLHLKTIFEVDTVATNFPQLGTVMLDLLHPTSAICGMPNQAAFEFLQQNESFDRGYFSGYLGPVNIEEETHIFVNLRCMQLQTLGATLYAGAGVTEDSNPQKEWLETQLKFDTLLSVLPKPA